MKTLGWNVLRCGAIFGGFLLGAMAVIMALSLCNPVSYQVDFISTGILTFAFICFYSLWAYPIATLLAGAVSGLICARGTVLLFRRKNVALAWWMGAAGYGVFFFMAFLGWKIYQALSGSGGYD